MEPQAQLELDEDGAIGRKELLQWASLASGFPCTKLEDLRDGSVFLKTFSKIWPSLVDFRQLRVKVCMSV
jgi:hypothetical protein